MIQRLQLSNWRAYDRLDLELGPGATFIVASNGIGKTSLIMGAAWGIFGDIAGVRGADEIRGDADEASVTVVLRLPSAGELTIARTVDRRGRERIEASFGRESITTQQGVERILGQEFGADARVLAQLTFMIHGGLHETQGEFTLRDHLAGLFGVRPLYESAERARAVAADAASALRKTKLAERKEQRDADELTSDLARAQDEMRTAEQARAAAVTALNEAAERLRLATEWTNYHGAQRERAAKLQAYAEVAGSLLGRAVEPDGALDALAQWETQLEGALAADDTEAATARGKADLIRDSVERLGHAEATCPTCLRPMSEHEAERAAAEHAQHLGALTATIAAAEERAAKQRAVLTNLKRVLADLRSVPMPVEPAGAPPGDGDEIRRVHDAARDEVQRLDADIAMRTAAMSTITDALAAIERDRALTEQITQLHRLEAIATAAAQTLHETAERIMEQQVEPLVAEVARRWKETFGRGGLHLSADGRITRTVGARTLSFGALSGGERVWALLVTRLLVAGASTRAPFVWLDEPLEHLDPRLRRIVAGTLAMASARAGLRQAIVTTYEAPIAQQLMEDVPSASLLYVTSAE